MTRTTKGLLALAAALAIAGCGEAASEDPDTTIARTTATTAAPANADVRAVDSGIEGVPIPATATLDLGAGTVEGMSYDELVEWYEREMPEGAGHGRWQWCDTGGGETIHAHIYAQPGRRILAVNITSDDPPQIIIGADRSGPC